MRYRITATALAVAVVTALGPLNIDGAAQAPAAQAPPAGRGGGGRGGGGARGGRGGGLIPPLLMKTDAFEDGGIIPERYAGRGGNVRPGFTFSNVPAGTVSFAIIFHDLDVAVTGTDDVLHWLAWNIPAKAVGSRRAPLRKAWLLELRELAAERTLALAPLPAPGTIITYSNSTP